MRYLLLIVLSLPIILIAMLNIVTQYKMGRIGAGRFKRQIILWIVILAVLVGSFPLYNHLNGKAVLDSSELSSFDIMETTAIVYLIYIVNDHRRKIEQTEKTIRDLHQELSIKLSSDQWQK